MMGGFHSRMAAVAADPSLIPSRPCRSMSWLRVHKTSPTSMSARCRDQNVKRIPTKYDYESHCCRRISTLLQLRQDRIELRIQVGWMLWSCRSNIKGFFTTILIRIVLNRIRANRAVDLLDTGGPSSGGATGRASLRNLGRTSTEELDKRRKRRETKKQ